MRSWHQQAVVLFSKDLRAELRTKVAVSAVGVFTFASLLLLGLATATLREVKTVNPLRLENGMTIAQIDRLMVPAWSADAKMGLLWVLLCFAAFSGLSHSFVHEEEGGTVTALRLSLSAGAVYAGKLTFNLAVISFVALITTPAYMLITGMPIGSPFVLILVMAGGCIGLAAAATILAALAAKVRGGGGLFAAIGLPTIVVFLMLLMNAARTLYVVDPGWVRIVKDVGGLYSYGLLLITLSALLFTFIWEE